MQYYVIVLLVYFGTDLLATWGLNLEFGVAGVANLGFIAIIAAGAYAYAVVTLGPSSGNGGFQSYIIGTTWPPVAGIALGAAVGAILGGLLGLTGLRRVRQDYQALVLLVAAILSVTVVSAAPRLFNGDQGLALIPGPLASRQSWSYVFLVGVVCIVAYPVVRRFTGGPIGRTLRACREDENAALSIGKSVVYWRIVAQVVGGVCAGLSGALLVGFIGAWSPSAWQYLETLALLTAIIIGGSGNDGGVLLGTALIPVLLLQGVQFLPDIPGHPGLTPQLSIILFSGLTIAFLFLRPQGLIPERRRRPRLPEQASPNPKMEVVGVWGQADHRPEVPKRDAPIGESTETSCALIELKHLSRQFGGVHAVDDVTVEIAAKTITGLIGPNGAGKSTLLGMVSGAIRPSSGKIQVDGTDVTSQAWQRRAQHGIVRTFQLPREFGRLTTLENLLVAAPNQRGESVLGMLLGRSYWKAEEQAHTGQALSLLELFEMRHQALKPARELSGGQKRMLEVMRALMVRPRLLLLDEPFAGLSPRLAGLLSEVLTTLDLSVLLVEHDLAMVEMLCDHVIVMAQGRILAEGAMSDLRVSKEVQDAYIVG